MLFSGAGIRGGTVHGASDDQAAYIAADPVNTGDVCASIYHCLGINPSMRVPDQLGRPVEIAHGGRPIVGHGHPEARSGLPGSPVVEPGSYGDGDVVCAQASGS